MANGYKNITMIIDLSSVTAGLIFFVSLWMANSKTSFEYNVFDVKGIVTS